MIYVASSWRNNYHIAVVAALKAAKLEVYNFKDDEGFHWSEVGGLNWKEASVEQYLKFLESPRAVSGFNRDFDAMKNSDTCVLVLPCGRSAHLEAGWFIGQGKPTAIYIPEEIEPELMYNMADYRTESLFDLLGWLGVPD